MSETENELSKVDWPATRYGILSGIIAGAITDPIVGGTVGGLLSVVGPTIENRLLNFWRRTDSDVQRLVRERPEVEFEKTLSSETFATAVWQIAQYVPRNHEQENLDALRNALLNSALPESPDTTRQKMFIEWAGELTAWHILLLKMFEDRSIHIPSLDLSNPAYRGGPAYDKLAELVEKKYPEMVNGYDLYMPIIYDLYNRELIANRIPEKEMMTLIEDRPVATPLAKRFLRFISSPLNEEKES